MVHGLGGLGQEDRRDPELILVGKAAIVGSPVA
jgi:hypothetical protein